MAAQLGNDFRLSIGNGAVPEVFTVVGGATQNGFQLTNDSIDITTKDTTRWNEILSSGGTTRASTSIQGVYKADAGGQLLIQAANGSLVKNCQLTFGNGMTITGPFHFAGFNLDGAHHDKLTYSGTLNSAGPLVFANI